MKTREVPILPPDSLLINLCDPETDFLTPRELGINDLKNISCIEQYQTSLQSLRDWKAKKIKLYNIENK